MFTCALHNMYKLCEGIEYMEDVLMCLVDNIIRKNRYKRIVGIKHVLLHSGGNI